MIAIVSILGCFGLVILAVSGMEGGYPVPNIDDVASKYADRTPQWSAGGERLVVNVEHRVLGVNVSGGEPFDIRGKRGWRQYSPSLSLDGRVAYETRRSGSSSERRIAVTDLLGSELEDFPQEEELYAFHPVWSPNGKHLAFVTHNSRSSDALEDRWLTILDAAGSGETRSIPWSTEVPCTNRCGPTTAMTSPSWNRLQVDIFSGRFPGMEQM